MIFRFQLSIFKNILYLFLSYAMVSKRHKSSPRGSKEHYAWIWECCNCRTQGGMNVESTDSCPSCYHYRCNSCALEERKIPVRETGKYSTTGLLPPCDAPSRTNFATSMSNTSLSNAEQRQNTAIVSTGQSPPGQSKGKNSISTSFEPEWVSNSLVDSLIKDPGTPSYDTFFSLLPQSYCLLW
jgi:hypothetical protein